MSFDYGKNYMHFFKSYFFPYIFFLYFEIQFLDHLLIDLPRVVNYLSPKLIQPLWRGFDWII